MEETKVYYYTFSDIFNKKDVYTTWSSVRDSLSDQVLRDYLTNLDNSNETTYLLNPLFERWMNNRIAILVSETDLSKELEDNKNRMKFTKMIWHKLNTILPKYKEEYKRLKAILDKDSFKTSSKSSNKATVKQNDTPTSYGDYRADNYMSNYSETSNENENSVETNELETYDAVVSRLRNLPQEIINEMKEFEIWI